MEIQEEMSKGQPDASNNKDFFGDVYRQNRWRGENSRSGPGSEGALAQRKVEVLRQWIETHGIHSLLDIGCGDFHWMRDIVPLLDVYVGVDIVPELIAENSHRYGSDKVSFREMDLTIAGAAVQLPQNEWDLITCLDVFGHLLNDEVSRLLTSLAGFSGARYLLVVNRRDANSGAYLGREKSREEGIDIECHPVFQRSGFRRINQTPASYPNDYFDLYERETGAGVQAAPPPGKDTGPLTNSRRSNKGGMRWISEKPTIPMKSEPINMATDGHYNRITLFGPGPVDGRAGGVNTMSDRAVRALARIPVIGYILKVIHDIAKLPVLRADLHLESVDLAYRLDRAGEQIESQAARLQLQDDRLAAISDRQALLESQGRAIKEQFDTLFQRVSDNLEEWVDLRRRVSAVESDAAVRHQDGLQLQSQMNAQEETFAEVLRRHGRALAVLQESIAAHSAAAQVPLDALGGVVSLVKALEAEMRSAAKGRQSSVDRSEPEASARPLFETSRSLSPEVRLNLGGGRPVKFCLHVAAAENANADLVADPGELPFSPASIAEIYANDLLENCSAKEGRRLLSHWSGLLQPEGTLHLIVTDLESAARSFANSSSSFEDLTRAILGHKGARQNAFSREALERLLQESGFHPVAEEPTEDDSANGFEVEIHATKAVRQFIPRRTRSIASA